MTMFLLAPSEFALPGVGSVNVASLPALSRIAPPFGIKADVPR
jgi:hypothetical protein